MAKVDLSSSEWCDLIFSGKNKAYGAYQLREKSPKRHNIAVILVIVIALIGFSIPTLIKMATPKQKEVMTEVTTLSQLEEPEIKQEEMKRVEPVAPPPPALKSSIKHFKGESPCCGGGGGSISVDIPQKTLDHPILGKKIVKISGMHCAKNSESCARHILFNISKSGT